MSRMMGKHFQTIRDQRIRLDEYRQHEEAIDALWASDTLIINSMVFNGLAAGAAIPNNLRGMQGRTFATQAAFYQQNLDFAEKRLKVAAAIGSVVDISDLAVGHDIRLVGKPKNGPVLGNQQRARDNLMAINFADLCGSMPNGGTHVTKLTIPTWQPLSSTGIISTYGFDFLHPEYQTVVLASFENRGDAVRYRLVN